MSTWKILLLGGIAGVTIFAGLPFGRYRSSSAALRCALSALATGILVFLFWDVTTNGVDPIEARIDSHHWVAFGCYAALLCAGLHARLHGPRLLRPLDVAGGGGSRLSGVWRGCVRCRRAGGSRS